MFFICCIAPLLVPLFMPLHRTLRGVGSLIPFPEKLPTLECVSLGHRDGLVILNSVVPRPVLILHKKKEGGGGGEKC